MNVRRVTDYARYKLKSNTIANIHSPFVYNLAKTVIYENDDYYAYQQIETIRKKWKNDRSSITVSDFGAGSRIFSGPKRRISDICKYSVKSAKYGQLLFRLVNHFQPQNLLELGTSLGITTSYMAAASRKAKIVSIEGDGATFKIAQTTIKLARAKNVELVHSKFQDGLPKFLNHCNKLDFVFIDGHHNKQATLDYFSQCLTKSHSETVFVFDDINWSEEMKETWSAIKENELITVTIDLHSMGLAFLKNGIEKQHFLLNF